MVRLPDVIATTSDRLGSHLSTNRLLLLLLLLHLLHLLHLLLLLLQVGQWVGGVALLGPLALSAASGRRWWLYDKK